MAPIADTIRDKFAGPPLVLDGATGTELERRGIKLGLPLWSAAALTECPDLLAAIHREYASAGAEIIVANTFRTNVRTLRHAGCLADGPELNRSAIELVRRSLGADQDSILVAASVAPVEDCYSPERVPDEDVLHEEHRQMMGWLEAAQPDLVWIETMNTIREARAAAEAAVAASLPFAVSFVVAETGDLLSGEPLEEAVAAVEPLAPLTLGLNCIPPRGLTALLPRLRQASNRPLAAYAHINNLTPIRGWSFAQSLSPTEYADFARQWLDLGANIIGGCCGTTPEHIKAIRGLESIP